MHKATITIFILFVFTATAWCECVEHRCHICGKKIYTQEIGGYHDNMLITWPPQEACADRAVKIDLPSYYICEDCYELISGCFQKSVQEMWDSTVELYAPIRKKKAEIERLKQIEFYEKQIRESESKIDELTTGKSASP